MATGRARLRRPRGSVRRTEAAREYVAPADDAARVTSRQEEPLRASAWPASPTNSGAQRRRGRERWPSGQVKARGQRGVAAATRLRPDLRSHRLSFRSQTSLRGRDRGAGESGGLPGRRAGARRKRATWSCSLSGVGGGRLLLARGRWQAGRAPSRPMAGLKVRREASRAYFERLPAGKPQRGFCVSRNRARCLPVWPRFPSIGHVVVKRGNGRRRRFEAWGVRARVCARGRALAAGGIGLFPLVPGLLRGGCALVGSSRVAPTGHSGRLL